MEMTRSANIRQVVVYNTSNFKWGKVFKNGPNKIYGRQPLKNLKQHNLLKQTISLKMF